MLSAFRLVVEEMPQAASREGPGAVGGAVGLASVEPEGRGLGAYRATVIAEQHERHSGTRASTRLSNSSFAPRRRESFTLGIMEFRCSDPSATVRAANVRATLDAFKLIPSVGNRLVEKHKLPLNDLRPDNVVPVQRWLDALAEIQSVIGHEVLRSVGAAIIENADFPPRFGSVESVLLALDEIYQLNHRGQVGHYIARKLGDDCVEVRCETPYPRQFERGLVEGITRHAVLAKGSKYSVQFVDGQPGADCTCTLIVRRTR